MVSIEKARALALSFPETDEHPHFERKASRVKKTYGEKEVHDVAHSFRRSSNGKTYTLAGYIGSSSPGVHGGLFMQFEKTTRDIGSFVIGMEDTR